MRAAGRQAVRQSAEAGERMEDGGGIANPDNFLSVLYNVM